MDKHLATPMKVWAKGILSRLHYAVKFQIMQLEIPSPPYPCNNFELLVASVYTFNFELYIFIPA